MGNRGRMGIVMKIIGKFKADSQPITMDDEGKWTVDAPHLDETLNLIFAQARLCMGGPEHGCPFHAAFYAAIKWFENANYKITDVEFVDQNVDGRIY